MIGELIAGIKSLTPDFRLPVVVRECTSQCESGKMQARQSVFYLDP